MNSTTWLWAGFSVFILLMLSLDLGLLNRKAHAIKYREAAIWSGVWVTLAMMFAALVFWYQGSTRGLEFLTGYLIEEALSVDNLFVFIMIFSYFRVDRLYQHRVLFWGILGAIIMRAAFIGMGVALISKFHWIIYVFGGFLIVTGIKMAAQKDKELKPDKNPVLNLLRRWIPVTKDYEGGKFFVKRQKQIHATPLFVVLVLLETTDLVFAVDSIPAVLAISHDPLIVYTSNVFAILGLRSIFFALAGIIQLFQYLQYGLSVILVFVGIKMVISNFYKIPVAMALGVVAGILIISVIASLLWPPRNRTSVVDRNDPS